MDIHKVLLQIKDKPVILHAGICVNMIKITGVYSTDALGKLLEDRWDKFSGNIYYPIAAPICYTRESLHPREYYERLSASGRLWECPNRMDALDVLITNSHLLSVKGHKLVYRPRSFLNYF